MPTKRKWTETLSPEVKAEIKEEKAEPPEISGADGVLNVQNRLKGALQNLLDHSDDSLAGTGHDDCSAGTSHDDWWVGTSHDDCGAWTSHDDCGAWTSHDDCGAWTSHDDSLQNELFAKQAIKKGEPVVSPQPTSQPPLPQRRRRRKKGVKETTYHHQVMLKLFERSVDLAQFKEGTPLYPICRGWMGNQPRNTNLVSKFWIPTPEPQASSEGGDSGDKSDAELVRDTYKLPPPMPTLSDGEIRTLRAPDVVNLHKKSEDIDMDLKTSTVNHETLLQNHIQHWVSVRNSWHAASRKNELRFQDSGRFLKAIYKPKSSKGI